MQPHLIPPSSLFSFLFFFFVFCNLLTSLSADYEWYTECAPFQFPCGGKNYNISYPFGVPNSAPLCFVPGYNFTCVDDLLVLEMGYVPYVVNEIDYEKNILTIVKKEFLDQSCPYTNTTIDQYLFSYTDQVRNLTVFYGCSTSVSSLPSGFQSLPCLAKTFFTSQTVDQVPNLFISCHVSIISIFQTAVDDIENEPSVFVDKVEEGFNVTWTFGTQWCGECQTSGGLCGYNVSAPLEATCFCKDGLALASCQPGQAGNKSDAKGSSNGTKNRKIAIGVGAGVGGSIIAGLLLLIYFRYCKKRSADSPILLSLATSSNAFSSHPSSTSEFGKSTSLLVTQIFSYEELEEATNHFNPSKELGDGGFGTVYHGKLRDGRHVAVKRLYENNYRRVEQFINEIDILSRLRHQNLVSLYGCTSRHSRELLLVYEYIPNGTVADHLHGNRAKNGSLKWPVRMSIAIETADALAYLHAVEIIHRDVKSNNILLDNNFRVKVADFGLSRLFPIDKTHVSTAPQGTPGYVDPDYHRCYQLNDKSDVYSFGVVLIELISSKPAVDITRHRHEINLANMAINKIHNNTLHELVDPTIGYQSDPKVTRMVKLVAELAFRCLQDEKEDRPSMEEVLGFLREMEREDYRVEKVLEVDFPAKDDAVLLKKNLPPSPDSVATAWTSRSTTPNTSG